MAISCGKKLSGYIWICNYAKPHSFTLEFHTTKRQRKSAGSFTKFTAHQFKKYLTATNIELLEHFKSTKIDRAFQFWKRDPLAVPIDSEKIFLQKLEYIHLNPTTEKWNLAILPEDYKWSSAKFYEDGMDEFRILKHYIE